MSGLEGREELEILAQRLDFVDQLEDGPLHKPDLVETLHHSRSTVDRAIRDLEEAGFVERVRRGYVTTQTGRLLAEQYRTFLEEFDARMAGSEVVDAIPADHEVPLAVFEDATVDRVDGPYELFSRVSDVVGAHDRCRIALPNVFDSRHVRGWHSQVVRGDRTIELFTSPSVLDQLAAEFPQLTNELAAADGFHAHELDPPPFGLVAPASVGADTVADDAGEVLLITYEDDGIAGVVETAGPGAESWMDDQFEAFRASGERTTDRLWSEDVESGFGAISGTRLSPSLRAEGFVSLDDQFLAEREPIPPETGWQAGLGLAEVADGQAVDRHLDADRTLGETVLERLDGGTDVAVLGPAGSGKSTLCKRVACEWATDRGWPVLYREGGQGQSFSSVRLLEDHLRTATDPVLVVVEDAIRAEARECLAAMHRLAGRDDVVFLLDARESEWHDPDTPLDPRIDAFRRDAPAVVSMPSLDEADCRELVTTAESLLDATIEVDSEELLASVREDDADDHGTMLLLIHRLATLADPLAKSVNGGTTTLDDDVDRIRRELAAAGEPALEVGLVANVLNAANVELHPELLYAVAVTRLETPIDEVEAAREQLEGHVLVSRRDRAGYQGIHESWSTRFLERHLEAEGEREASRQFERCLSALFRLAEDPGRCERLAEFVDGSTPALDAIVADPTGWADDLATSVFELGTGNAAIAPLFGTSDDPVLDLPSVCSPDTALRCLERRGRMYTTAGEYDVAAREFERFRARCSERGDRRGAAKAIMLHGRARRLQSEYERARDCYEESLRIAREIEDDEREAKTLGEIGTVLYYQGAYEQAQEYDRRALEIARELEATHVEADCLTDLGMGEVARSNYEQARTYLEESLSLQRQLGNREGELATLGNLALVEKNRGNYEQSRSYLTRSLEFARELGDRHATLLTLGNLGIVARLQGRSDRAQQYHERALDLSEAVGNTTSKAQELNYLGRVAEQRAEYETAREYFERAFDIARDNGLNRIEAVCWANLGEVAVEMGRHEVAAEHLERALDRYDDLGESLQLADAWLRDGWLALDRRDLEAARHRAVQALAEFDRLGTPHYVAWSRHLLGEIERTADRHDVARDHLRAALEGFEAVGAPHDALDALQALVETCREAGDDEAARRYRQRGDELLATAPDSVREQYGNWSERTPTGA